MKPGDGREAVGGAGRVRDDRVRRRQLVVVHAVDDGDVLVGRGCRDQHLLRAGRQVLRGAVAAREDARAFHRDVDAELAPGQLRRIALLDRADRVAVDDDRAAFGAHLERRAAVDAVRFEEVRVRLDVGEVVDRHDLDVGPPGLDQRAQDEAPDAPETVDADLDRHE
jgi:hypothetical protein